ncbi:BREX-1 system adenine-specific DNA-methyltransferase PglX [Cyanobium sp. Candia 9D4]|uniref:BREX-1 system adenine-specific DNA-methyltransferase PglX n=1 Tax=Cyanobium sp. Candia 9D4 TaxID=2823707 RepID=UPI0020CB91ED|nr:BREX-1 system adenine-specific DNA-methyltransferase PglX [Cyanobium sp. Candia 9D4]MCP9932691.1 BREX-1 system adenine-specific DNA-methyltransferase PglX [Cyanobium sp. Candia 9D4]
MPVNTAALKTFAPAMRRQLLEAVGRKLDLLLNSQTPDTLSTYAKQIAELREQEGENREQLQEKVAYTWFNRLCALRYLDAKGWHPFGCRVLMPAVEGETQPELLKLMRAGSLPAELKAHTNEARLHRLLDGQIPPAVAGADPQGEVYRELVLASCRSYHQLLPELFEGLDDASELLLPDDLLSEGSIAGGFRSAISDEDCADVEIIGWLYQFYISEKKDQVIGKVVKSEDIPAATQLFTPNWIVKYMVQNSLGATWLATYPNSPLKGQMEFYIEPAEQTPEVQAQLAAITPESLNPEELTLIDPACGSGHILVEAYDLLKAIYLERGYRQRDIPELILTKNLYGLDICPRAAQLSVFSLLMKGREDDRRLLDRGIQLNVMALQDSTGLNVERLAESMDLPAAGVSRADLRMLVELFAHATTFGSLIQVPRILAKKLPALSRLAEQTSHDLFTADDPHQLEVMARLAAILARRYDVVVANPPYMGNKYFNESLKLFAKKEYSEAAADLYSCFIARNLLFANETGKVGMITIPNWMFLSTFSKLRAKLLRESSIMNLLHNGRGLWGADFGSCAFVLLRSGDQSFAGVYRRLFLKQGEVQDNIAIKNNFANEAEYPGYQVTTLALSEIPGAPIAYWISPAILSTFRYAKLRCFTDGEGKNVTSDNERFVRFCWEVNSSQVGIGQKWLAYAKGGSFRKWSGNLDHVVDWSEEARRFYKVNHVARIIPEDLWYREGITWTDVTSAGTAFRSLPPNTTFDATGLTIFVSAERNRMELLGLLNSAYARSVLPLLNPTLHVQLIDVKALPIADNLPNVSKIVEKCVELAQGDWDNFETSHGFRAHPLLDSRVNRATLETSWLNWQARSTAAIRLMQDLETENNRLFIAAYGLEGELQPEVPEDQITLARADQRKDVAAFLSYATGCIMGRYSLDQPGLILADSRSSQSEQLAAYEEKVVKPLSEVQFNPDPDGILPVLDGEWFEDDIVARTREFLAVTFPESSLAENLRFIEESLGKDIRKYFCTEFYKDHLQTYKKRPIYWLVQSPKKGFSCLIYLHRYTKDTLNLVLNNYFRPYLQKLEARLAQLGLDQLNDALPTRDRTAARKEAEKIAKVLKECQAWEQDSLLPLAQQRIELDLDDGVKVNYLKLQDVLAPIPGLAAKED